MSQWIKDLAAQRRAFADRLAERQSLRIPATDPDYEDLGRGVPYLDSLPQGRDLAAAQARDPAIPADTGTRHRPRSGHGGRELTLTPVTVSVPVTLPADLLSRVQ